MTLQAELERAAAAASGHGRVSGVLAAETAGRRVYLIALGGEERRWLVLDDGGEAIAARETVRDAASIVALCELAADVAGGGDLAGLRAHVAELRRREDVPDLAAAEEAIAALERTIGAPPRVATPAYLDAVGAATLDLERALGDVSSPFADALRSGTGVVEEFVRDVERGYLIELR